MTRASLRTIAILLVERQVVTPKDAEAFLLRSAGLTFQLIALHQGCSRSTAHDRVQRVAWHAAAYQRGDA